nr:restriction endonuclease subunit S [Bifidobacterium bifidum]
MSAINYLPPFANSLIMHVLTNAEKLIPLRDAASLAESRRLAGMRMVTGTTSPSTRYERISVSPASCSIKSEYVIASHAFKPQYKCINYIPTWEQRKLVELYEKNDERNTFGLGAERTLSIATMTFNSEGNGADASSLPNYKVIRVGDVAFEGHSNKSFAYGRFVVNAVADGIMSPRFSCLRPKNSYPVRFWKYYIHSEQVMRDILVRATKSGTMMNELVIDDLFKQSIAVPQEAEQQAIGYFFSHLDTLITLHQRKRESRIIRVRSFIWLAGDISGIGVSAYQPEKRRPYDRRQHQRRNVVLRLLRAMDQRIQGRCNS